MSTPWQIVEKATIMTLYPAHYISYHYRARQILSLKNVDFSAVLNRPAEADKFDIRYVPDSASLNLDGHLDHTLIEESGKAIKGKEKVWLHHPIANTDRAIGAMLSGVISQKYGENGLPEDTIHAIEAIKEHMGSIGETVVRLSDQSQAIEEIIATVQDLADQ
ncbi:MAG: hypothetical protein P8Y91_09285, partial [Desulfuromonadales bacterium]